MIESDYVLYERHRDSCERCALVDGFAAEKGVGRCLQGRFLVRRAVSELRARVKMVPWSRGYR